MDRQTTNSSREPSEFVRKGAQVYNEKHGFGRIIEGLYVSIDTSRARKIADAYEALPIDDSDNAAVRNSYHRLAAEIEEQWKFAVEVMGMTFEPWRHESEPYANRSAAMCADVRSNRHLYFYQGGDPHPFLGKADSATGLRAC